MPQEAIKRRYDYCRDKVWDCLSFLYPDAEKVEFPFDFKIQDQNGLRYIRVEVDALDGAVEKAIIAFKKKCPHNTIFEIKIFEKHKQRPESYTL